ncbi:hypothetical protein CH293_19950 [Rhodococcus sp. 14-2470-1b]|uniref:hypothetical protein n=1 Tax=Rhodococcus sp. 14-2470-1b TaxID=2023149 RepID=UPI000B9B7290|nr:hypothetical protein [Rhodococcus sp. 14-2470-1b]OZF47269.1 hypothetical protein CH293_19950 [Rhodococcus sp. 14-2470-1b]
MTDSYDEVLFDVVARVESARSVGKADIGALLFWKRLRADTPWAMALHNMRDSDVRVVTGAMYVAANDLAVDVPTAAGQARQALIGLPGCVSGGALPSALILAAAPDRMAIYDKRALKALGILGIALDTSDGWYRGYMQTVETVRAEVRGRGKDWSARDVDKALFQLGK